MKTDNPEEVGIHVFQRAGLGLAPFRVSGFTKITYQACPGAPVQPGGSCDYCGTGIMYACLIQSSDGKQFKVGCDCVAKTGDSGLIKAYKKSPEYRAHQRELRHARDLVKRQELDDLMAVPEVRDTLKSQPHPTAYYAGQGLTLLDYYKYLSAYPSNAAWLLKKFKLLLNNPK